MPEFSADMFEERFRDDHSELVARLMVGSSFGFTPQARFACFPDSKLNFGSMREVYLIAALRIIENIEDVKNPKKGRCVINMSFELQPGTGTHHDIFKFWFGQLIHRFLITKSLTNRHGAVHLKQGSYYNIWSTSWDAYLSLLLGMIQSRFLAERCPIFISSTGDWNSIC